MATNPTEMQRLTEIYRSAAKLALEQGIAVDDSYDGPLARWVRENVRYRPDTEFFVVFGVACEMADVLAQQEGYRNASHRAASLMRSR